MSIMPIKNLKNGKQHDLLSKVGNMETDLGLRPGLMFLGRSFHISCLCLLRDLLHCKVKIIVRADGMTH